MNSSAVPIAAAFVGLLLLGAGGQALMHHSPLPAALQFRQETSQCHPSQGFHVGYPHDGASAVPSGRGFKMMGRSWVWVRVCKPTRLSVTARGELGGNDLPRLDVALDGELIAEEAFNKRRIVTINITRPGIVTLAYLNDYYESEYRMARIRFLPAVSSNDCREVHVQTTHQSSNVWLPDQKMIFLTQPDPIKLYGCNDKNVRFILDGKPLRGEDAVIKIDLHNSVRTLVVGKATGIQIMRSQEPIRVSLINADARQLADRNLIIEQIEYAPVKMLIDSNRRTRNDRFLATIKSPLDDAFGKILP